MVAAGMLVGLLWPLPSSACSCAAGPVAAAWQSAERVFTGRVTSVRLVDPAAEDEAPTAAEFAVLSPWKGIAPKTVKYAT